MAVGRCCRRVASLLGAGSAEERRARDACQPLTGCELPTASQSVASSSTASGKSSRLAWLRRCSSRCSRSPRSAFGCSAQDALPDPALAALEDLERGLSALKELHLPRGGEGACKKIAQHVEELKSLVNKGILWEQRCPEGGKLLWVQVCAAAGEEEPPEWTVGQLFVTKTCMLFEANDQPPWSVGPVNWADIVKFEIMQDSGGVKPAASDGRFSCDARLTYCQAGMGTSALRVQLGMPDVAWLEAVLPKSIQFVNHAERTRAPSNFSQMQLDDIHVCSEQTQVEIPHIVINATGSFQTTCGPGAPRSFNLGSTFFVEENRPPAMAPPKKEPLFSTTLPKATIEDIREALSGEEWLLETYIRDHLNSEHIVASPWAAGQRVPGTQVRMTRFCLPLAKDVIPSHIADIFKGKETALVTLVARYQGSQQDLVVVLEAYSHDIPYGENFLLQGGFTFRAQPDGSVKYDLFGNVEWVIQLPAEHKALKSFIEQQAQECAGSLGEFLGKRLQFGLPSAVASLELQHRATPPPPPTLTESLHLTGIFAKWKTDLPEARLSTYPSAVEGTALLRLCVKMTSESFSFQVVSSAREWTWRLYPRDAQLIRIYFVKTHISKEGFLTCGKNDTVVVGVGDEKAGHGLNFHVLESVGAIITVWVQVPVVRRDGNVLELRADTADNVLVWYTKEDTGVTCCGGDGYDLTKYREFLPKKDS